METQRPENEDARAGSNPRLPRSSLVFRQFPRLLNWFRVGWIVVCIFIMLTSLAALLGFLPSQQGTGEWLLSLIGSAVFLVSGLLFLSYVQRRLATLSQTDAQKPDQSESRDS